MNRRGRKRLTEFFCRLPDVRPHVEDYLNLCAALQNIRALAMPVVFVADDLRARRVLEKNSQLVFHYHAYSRHQAHLVKVAEGHGAGRSVADGS